MAGWIRRNWIPTAGMAVAVAFVGWLAWINVRGGGSGAAVATPSARVSVGPSPSVSPAASPTADPAEAQVEAAAKRWVAAYQDEYRTGDPSGLSALDVPGSQADGESGSPLLDMRQTGRTFLTQQVTYNAIQVDAVPPTASADVMYTVLGQDASWPSLATQGSPRQVTISVQLSLVLINGQWLVSTVH